MVKQQRNAMKNRITIDVGSQGSGVGVVGDCGARAIFVLQFKFNSGSSVFVTAPF